jgi:serine/threonine-protein kinase
MGQVLGALAFAHARGVAHLDLKSQNVLLDYETMRVKLADFGGAMLVSPAPGAQLFG